MKSHLSLVIAAELCVFVGVCVCVSQLFSRGRQVFRELGEAEVGAVDHVGLTATFSRTHWFTVTLVVQTSVLGAWTQTRQRTRRTDSLSKS